MPWRVSVMLCGVTVLIALIEKAQGIDLLVSLVAKTPSATTVAFWRAPPTKKMGLSVTTTIVRPCRSWLPRRERFA